MPASPSGPADRPPSAPDAPVAPAAARDVLAMYPLLREDHFRYLQKWGFISRVRNDDGRFSSPISPCCGS